MGRHAHEPGHGPPVAGLRMYPESFQVVALVDELRSDRTGRPGHDHALHAVRNFLERINDARRETLVAELLVELVGEPRASHSHGHSVHWRTSVDHVPASERDLERALQIRTGPPY